ncbi:hypothetical protein BGX31_002997 [Mortierella sp. GBA43]|nr:hypothetical protein BGX31_002997 [Mortierella sp. GBA43]
MRPDPHKQAASRRYQSKVRSRGGGTAGTTDDAKTGPAHNRGGGRGGSKNDRRGRGGHHSRSNASGQEEDTQEGETSDSAPKKSYARRKIVSNADRYIERDEEVTEAEELEQGIDRQTIAFREMLKDSDQKMTFDPAAYFRFKSEKEVETQDPAEESQLARKLLEIRLDDIEKALMTLSVKERLYLQDSDARALDRDIVGKVSLSSGKPIIPKLVRGQAASDMLIKPSATPAGMGASSAGYSKAGSLNEAQQDDDDLDDLLDVTTTYGRPRPTATEPKTLVSPATPTSTTARTALATGKSPETQASSSKIRLPPPVSKGTKGPSSSAATTSKKPPPSKSGQPRAGANMDEEWLDSVLGM